MTLPRCTQTFLEIRPCRARPGRAKPSQAGQGRRLGPAPGQSLDLAGFRKTVNSTTRNVHFRAGPPKLIVSSTQNDHFQNSIHTSALDDPRPDDPTAPHIFQSGKKRHASAAKCVVFSGPRKNATSQNPLLNLKGQRAQMSRTDFQPIWNSPELPPSLPARARAEPHRAGPGPK